MGLFALIVFLVLPIRVGTQNNTIDLGDFPTFEDIRNCGRICLSDVGTFLGCADNDCLCGHEADGISYIQGCAITGCSSSSEDVYSATSFFSAYCGSYLNAVSAAATATTTGGVNGIAVTTITTTIFTPTGIFTELLFSDCRGGSQYNLHHLFHRNQRGSISVNGHHESNCSDRDPIHTRNLSE